MSVRSALRLGSALLGLTLVAAACSGAAGNGANAGNAGTGAGNGSSGSTLGSANGGSGDGAAASAEPTFDLGSLLSPDPGQDGTPAASPANPPIPTQGGQPTQKPAGTPPVISTARASSLLSQVDSLLNDVNVDLSNADSDANNPGE